MLGPLFDLLRLLQRVTLFVLAPYLCCLVQDPIKGRLTFMIFQVQQWLHEQPARIVANAMYGLWPHGRPVGTCGSQD